MSESAIRSRPPGLGNRAIWPLAVFLLSVALIEAMEAHFRRYAIDGIYFQRWPSETLMQSVSLRELRNAPIESLWYLHVQPPVTNLIRAAIVAFRHESSWVGLMRGVDIDLYHLWALVSGALAALIDAWLRRMQLPRALALCISLGWLLSPANLAFVTLLDGTLLSCLLTTWIVYETWRLGGSEGGSVGQLGTAVLLAYFTRSLFQWPFLLLMIGALTLQGVSRRRVMAFGAVVGLVIGLYSLKQHYLFGTVSTSTLEGTNLTRSLGADCSGFAPIPAASDARLTAPVLTERRKLEGTLSFNHVERLSVERGLMACYRRTLAERTVASLLAAYATNARLLLRPSSTNSPNAIVDRLPWRGPIDWLFSGWRWVAIVLVAGSVGLWRSRRQWWQVLAVAAPCAYVLAIGVVGERGENMRFKVFLEPSIWVLLTVQSWFTIRWLWGVTEARLQRQRQRRREHGQHLARDDGPRPERRNLEAGGRERLIESVDGDIGVRNQDPAAGPKILGGLGDEARAHLVDIPPGVLPEILGLACKVGRIEDDHVESLAGHGSEEVTLARLYFVLEVIEERIDPERADGLRVDVRTDGALGAPRRQQRQKTAAGAHLQHQLPGERLAPDDLGQQLGRKEQPGVEHVGQDDQRDAPELLEHQPPVALPLQEEKVRASAPVPAAAAGALRRSRHRPYLRRGLASIRPARHAVK